MLVCSMLALVFPFRRDFISFKFFTAGDGFAVHGRRKHCGAEELWV